MHTKNLAAPKAAEWRAPRPWTSTVAPPDAADRATCSTPLAPPPAAALRTHHDGGDAPARLLPPAAPPEHALLPPQARMATCRRRHRCCRPQRLRQASSPLLWAATGGETMATPLPATCVAGVAHAWPLVVVTCTAAAMLCPSALLPGGGGGGGGRRPCTQWPQPPPLPPPPWAWRERAAPQQCHQHVRCACNACARVRAAEGKVSEGTSSDYEIFPSLCGQARGAGLNLALPHCWHTIAYVMHAPRHTCSAPPHAHVMPRGSDGHLIMNTCERTLTWLTVRPSCMHMICTSPDHGQVEEQAVVGRCSMPVT